MMMVETIKNDQHFIKFVLWIFSFTDSRQPELPPIPNHTSNKGHSNQGLKLGWFELFCWLAMPARRSGFDNHGSQLPNRPVENVNGIAGACDTKAIFIFELQCSLYKCHGYLEN